MTGLLAAAAAPRFNYDLGPAEIDVAGYPKKFKSGYNTFKRTCSRCHTLARPINSPFAVEGEVILDFLEYDSRRRKSR